MNVLLTCAGRRNYLVQYFQEALGGRGKVYAADMSADASALYVCDDSFIVPPLSQDDYFDVILDICQAHDIGLLISLNDLELPSLACQQERFKQIGTLPIISAPRVVDTCFDKWRTFEFLKSHGINAPQTYININDALDALAKGSITFPMVLKPRWGTASVGIDYVEDTEELALAYTLSKKRITRTMLAKASSVDPDRAILIQELLVGQEYGLDIINDLDGRYATTFCKRKLAMRAGETDRAVTIENSDLQTLGKRLGQTLGHIGNLDCDVFATEAGYYILEMNPRFGGGYPFSHTAGANLPSALVSWALGEEPDPSWLSVEPNVLASKFDNLIRKDGFL